MMYINDRYYDLHWHIGEPVPALKARVVTFQADGDELDLILEAMRKTRSHQ